MLPTQGRRQNQDYSDTQNKEDEQDDHHQQDHQDHQDHSEAKNEDNRKCQNKVHHACNLHYGTEESDLKESKLNECESRLDDYESRLDECESRIERLEVRVNSNFDEITVSENGSDVNLEASQAKNISPTNWNESLYQIMMRSYYVTISLCNNQKKFNNSINKISETLSKISSQLEDNKKLILSKIEECERSFNLKFEMQ